MYQFKGPIGIPLEKNVLYIKSVKSGCSKLQFCAQVVNSFGDHKDIPSPAPSGFGPPVEVSLKGNAPFMGVGV